MVRQTIDLMIAFIGNGNHRSAPCPHVFDVGENLVVRFVLGGNEDNGHVLVDQRDGTMLHLRRWITLGMDIGDLLELQGTFERSRELIPPA